ncbi:MAG: DUF1553 domain-containing protein, partial [Planctomycetaceae bacterium]|nr:DUF1553 domain-containing protein [Planctomycetaceae bacterium]
HDHKYDPLTGSDYYRLRAIFEPHQVRLDPVPGVTDLEQNGIPRVFDDHPEAVTYIHRKGDPKNPDTSAEIRPGIPAIFADMAPEPEPIELPPSAYAPIVRDYVQQDLLRDATAKVDAAEKELAAAKAAVAEANARAQPDSPATGSPAASESDETAKSGVIAEDDFEQPNPDLWEIIGTGWEYRDGALHQTAATREAAFVKLKRPLPRDFDLTCRYTHTGGATYKSVTFRFDESANREYANFVYTSAHEPGPKVQAAFTRTGQTTYPSEARAARPIRVGETYTLRFAVRDRLLNVWLNGDFVLAWQLPDRRPEGHFTMSGFDATVAFDHLRIEQLTADTQLTPADKSGTPSRDPQQRLQLAELSAAAARAALASLQATIDAELAAVLSKDTPQILETARTAAERQALAAIAQADVDLLPAGDDANKQKAAREKKQAAEKRRQSIAATTADQAVEFERLRVTRKGLETPEHKETDYAPVYSPVSTGRRLALARWIASPQNPLTARVIVNHVWMRHFGEPLVETVFDFGLRTPPPLHAALLDRLSADFIRSGWSFRHLHHLIATSAAWQRSSSERNADAATVTADPDNLNYWRMNARRMESQIVRDSLLVLSGTLDRTVGGPSLDADSKSNRRSLYFKHSADDQNRFLSMFDDADLLECYRRSESIVPQQALALANSEMSLSMAEPIAARIAARIAAARPGHVSPAGVSPTDVRTTDDGDSQSQNSATDAAADRRQFVTEAFVVILGRYPDEEELTECLTFCNELQQAHAKGSVVDSAVSANASSTTDKSPGETAPEHRIRTRLIHALINHNDFITIR